jgi:tetratricopeptide (TPR) repeat protein
VAQVSWAADQFTDFVIDQSVLSTPLSFEARAWTCYHSAQWQKSLAETWYWLSDQPFSARPAVHGSFLASALLEDYAQAIKIGEAGLIANPRDFSLLNNIAVALAKSGEVEKASGVFSRINTSSLSQLNQVVWKATAGLLRFRSNQPDDGRRLYLEAMDKGSENGLNTMTARASVYLANEEIAAKTPQWKGAMVRAHGLTKGTNDPITKELFNRLLETKKPMDIVAS